MNEPLLLNTLSEAASWLTHATNETWNEKRVIDAALRIYRDPYHEGLSTCLKAVAPLETHYVIFATDATGSLERKGDISWHRPIALYPFHLHHLLTLGEAHVGVASTPSEPDGRENTYIFVEPDREGLRVTMPMVRISEENLRLLASSTTAQLPSAADTVGDDLEQAREDKPLTARERNTLLKIIAALCAEQDLDLSKPFKAGEIIKNRLNQLGFDMKIDTIADKLKAAKSQLE